VNVGAGTGCCEPRGRRVTAVEPSAVMIGQRPPDAARRCRRRLALLAADLGSGEWDARCGGLRTLDELDLGYRLVTARRE